MRDVFATAAAWLNEGHACAFATLIELREAKTAPLGTTIAIDDGGRIAGNIGAGCYEGEIVEAMQQTLSDGAPRMLDVNLESFDELAGGTGCGAQMRLAIWRPERDFLLTARAIAEGERDVTLRVGEFIRVFPRKDTLLLVGATSLAADIAAIACRLEWRVIVVDPRPAFATRERVADAHEIVQAWPDDYLPGALDARTSIVVLSHDPKFDLPALRLALRSDAPYIGLLGSRRAQAARRTTLRAEGFTERDLARIHGPAGLDIGGATTAETALSILAEVIAERNGRSGEPLLEARGAIH